MRDEEFITEVLTRAEPSGRADAERVVRATLAVLGEQLPDDVAAVVAAALPERLGEQLWGRVPRTQVTAAQAGRLSKGVGLDEGSWPGDSTRAGVEVDEGNTSSTD